MKTLRSRVARRGHQRRASIGPRSVLGSRLFGTRTSVVGPTVEGLELRALLTFPAVVELSALNGSDGFQISGEAAGDRSGFSVSEAGDINGDGIKKTPTSGHHYLRRSDGLGKVLRFAIANDPDR